MTNMTEKEFEAYIDNELTRCNAFVSGYRVSSYNAITELVSDRYKGKQVISIDNLEFAMELLKDVFKKNIQVTLTHQGIWFARIGEKECASEFLGYAIVGAWLKWKGL